jgi:hypothetical protein
MKPIEQSRAQQSLSSHARTHIAEPFFLFFFLCVCDGAVSCCGVLCVLCAVVVHTRTQRNERRKWIHCFEKVTALLFVTAISEYDEMLYEDHSVNRMAESIHLFGEICSWKWFTDTPIILFLNKSDLFREKIKTIDLTGVFPEYTGGCDYDKGLEYIRDMFLSTHIHTLSALHSNAQHMQTRACSVSFPPAPLFLCVADGCAAVLFCAVPCGGPYDVCCVCLCRAKPQSIAPYLCARLVRDGHG